MFKKKLNNSDQEKSSRDMWPGVGMGSNYCITILFSLKAKDLIPS